MLQAGIGWILKPIKSLAASYTKNYKKSRHFYYVPPAPF
jgi:hypothetical protein